MENNTTTVGILAAKVAGFKLIARDALRMNLITPRLSKIASIENEVKNAEAEIKDLNHIIAVHAYEISKMDVNHPNYATDKASAEECSKYHADKVESVTKFISALQDEITKQNEGIAKIESGETKVSLDALNDLVSDMIKKDALNQVK